MPISEIEQEFAKTGSTWVPKIHEYLESPPDKAPSPYDDEFAKKLYDYPTCFVGEIRDKLGLSREYHWISDINNEDYCYFCKLYAGDIYVDVLEERDQPGYLIDLVRLKNHLKENHNKEI